MLLKHIISYALFSSIFIFSASAHSQLIIANSSVEQEHITRTMLNSVFSLTRKQWPNGQPIIVYELPIEHDTHQDLSDQILGISSKSMHYQQQRQMLSGSSNMIRVVESEEEMIREVAKTPGSIGYTHRKFEPQNNINIMSSEQLKVMEVVEQ